MMFRIIILLFICLVAANNMMAQKAPKQEMRAIWIATVENIDWPGDSGNTVEVQKQELIQLLDLATDYKMNTVVFQVRPAADAFYNSSFEPWSQWLTGIQGKAPEPFYDPLEFIISECRKRGLDIHVWLNPYRALKDTSYNADSSHITLRHPEWFVTYGKTIYFNPALPETRNHVAAVVGDIVRRYDVDAIHMDDYFYPYRIAGINFPDDSSFALYQGKYKSHERDDWRRNNVDLIIKQLHDTIKTIKPWVEFGISPFGVWRNDSKDSSGSATKAGQTNYDDLFADILKWQREGWIDYITPQLYWHIGMKVADYKVLAEWWNKNTFGCKLYIGQAFYRLDRKSNVKAWKKADEIVNQIRLNRSLPQISGSMFFSAKYLRTDPLRLRKHLNRVYPYRALVPPANRTISIIPEPPSEIKFSSYKEQISISWDSSANVKYYIVYKFDRRKAFDFTNPQNMSFITTDTFLSFKNNCRTSIRRHAYAITSLSITNHESGPTFLSHH